MQRTKCYAVTMSRTETAKKLRKAYENHLIHHGFNEYRYMTIRKDEISNTISTVIKDFIICEVYKKPG
jgi:arsenate reductase-like glutaredoxin family protein